MLQETDEWLDAKGLADRLAGAKIKTVQNELSRITREKPRPFVRDSETARKGQPRRYHGMRARADIPHDSRNDGGNEGTKPQNVTPLRRPDGEVVFT